MALPGCVEQEHGRGWISNLWKKVDTGDIRAFSAISDQGERKIRFLMID